MRFWTVVYDNPDTCYPMIMEHFDNYEDALEEYNEIDPKRDYTREWCGSPVGCKPKKKKTVRKDTLG